MCGEYNSTIGKEHPEKGSPPHVWRIQQAAENDMRAARITSTCVENTFVNLFICNYCQDHLHMCGEYITQIHELTKY